MTEKQIERVKTKIKKIKAALAADKKRWGGFYDDSRGLRYAPPRLYIQIADFSGGLRYMNWFQKNFPDDSCYPDFLFEWTIILFKTGRLKEAEKKAFQTFCHNTYLFDKFFNKEIIPIDKFESSNLEVAEFIKSSFDYIHSQDNLTDFSEWLNNFIKTEKFVQQSNKLIEINKRLKNEKDSETRWYLIEQADQLEKEF
jgi:hypothetical protein